MVRIIRRKRRRRENLLHVYIIKENNTKTKSAQDEKRNIRNQWSYFSQIEKEEKHEVVPSEIRMNNEKKNIRKLRNESGVCREKISTMLLNSTREREGEGKRERAYKKQGKKWGKKQNSKETFSVFYAY